MKNTNNIDIVDRLLEAVAQVKGKRVAKTQKKIAEMMGINEVTLSRALKGNERYLTDSFIENFSKVFGFDPKWLKYGEGSMFVENQKIIDVDKPLPVWRQDIIVAEKDIYINSFGIKFIPIPNGKYQMIVPMLNAPAQASFMDNYQDAEYISSYPEVESFVVDSPMQGNYASFRILNESMYCDNPHLAILPEDIALARELQRVHWKNKLKINDFPEWVIYTIHNVYPLIKNISNHNVEEGIITCHSYNDKVADFDLSLNDVRALFYVIDIKRKRNNKFNY